MLSKESRRVAAAVLVLFPTVIFGGAVLLAALIGDPEYSGSHLRQDLWRAGHAHAGVLLILALVVLPIVDQAALPPSLKQFVRLSCPTAAILFPMAFFLSVPEAAGARPSAVIYLAYVAGGILAVATILLGIGLIRVRDS